MVLPSGDPKIMDFGIAKAPASQLTRAGEIFGTPSFMSPEQARGRALDHRSDLFSLGAVLYQMLTGAKPFAGASTVATLTAVIDKDPPPPSRKRDDLPAEADYVTARALAKDRDARYPDGRTLAEDLEDVLEGRAPTLVLDLLNEASQTKPNAVAPAVEARSGGGLRRRRPTTFPDAHDARPRRSARQATLGARARIEAVASRRGLRTQSRSRHAASLVGR